MAVAFLHLMYETPDPSSLLAIGIVVIASTHRQLIRDPYQVAIPLHTLDNFSPMHTTSKVGHLVDPA